MTRLWFVVPVWKREPLTALCLRQLARVCREVAAYGIDATAVVVGEGASLTVARRLGFATVRRSNEGLGRKFNDGFQLACDPDINPQPADYAVPCGSDDWVDSVIFKRLPRQNEIGVFMKIAVVNEQRTVLRRVRVPYPGGAGIRIIPRGLLEHVRYRPAEEDRNVGLDGSMLLGLRRAMNRTPRMVELDVHELQIVDWKSRATQLHPFRELTYYRGEPVGDPFEALNGVYPARALREMRGIA